MEETLRKGKGKGVACKESPFRATESDAIDVRQERIRTMTSERRPEIVRKGRIHFADGIVDYVDEMSVHDTTFKIG